MNNIALGRTIPARKLCQSFGARQLPWCHPRQVSMPSPAFELEHAPVPAGLYGAVSADGVKHASLAIAREWTAARSNLGGVS